MNQIGFKNFKKKIIILIRWGNEDYKTEEDFIKYRNGVMERAVQVDYNLFDY